MKYFSIILFIFISSSIFSQDYKNRYRFSIGTGDFSRNAMNISFQYERKLKNKIFIAFRQSFKIREINDRNNYKFRKLFGNYVDEINILDPAGSFHSTNYFVTNDGLYFHFFSTISVIKNFTWNKFSFSVGGGMGLKYYRIEGVFDVKNISIVDDGYPSEPATALVQAHKRLFELAIPVQGEISYFISDKVYIGLDSFFGVAYNSVGIEFGLHFGVKF